MRGLGVIATLLLPAGIALNVFVARPLQARGRAAGAQIERENTPTVPVMMDSVYAPDVFRLYCAPCHGRDGKGGGPVATALKTRPPNLTEIARRNGGVFPKARVEEFVTNGGAKPSPAHGSVEMPVWGPTFRSLDPSDARVRMRIGNLVDYLESIQTEHDPSGSWRR